MKNNDLQKMLVSSQFTKLIEALKEMEINETMYLLKERIEGLPNKLEEILFTIPSYLFKVDEDDNKTVEYHEGALELIQILLDNGANPNAVFNNGMTPFMKACELSKNDIVKQYLANESNPARINQGDGKGNMPLFYATMAEATDVMETLVNEYKDNVDHRSILTYQQTVFHYACGHAKEKSIDKLIELKANPLLRDTYEQLPAQLIPEFDEDLHDIKDFTQEEIDKWDNLFKKMEIYTKNYKNKEPARKLNF